MQQTTCPHCKKELERQTGAAFCPFCGGPLGYEADPEAEPAAVRELLGKLESITDVRKKHDLLLEAEKEYPDSLTIAQELLYMGRLYERGSKNVDFSIIKCYLLTLYLSPEQFSEKRRDELRDELFSHPYLLKCLSLCEDREAFLRAYLLRVSGEFINLFLRGDSRYMRRLFGFGLEGRAPKLLAAPAAEMLLAMDKDDKLTSDQRDILTQQFYQAFSREMMGETSWLNERLQQAGIGVPGTI